MKCYFAMVVALLLTQRVLALPAPAALPEQLSMFVGESVVVAVDARRIAVGNNKVLTVSSAARFELLLVATGAGTTVLNVWSTDGTRLRSVVTVTAQPLAATLSSVRELLRGVEGVSARVVGERIALEGTQINARARERATAVAGLYPGQVVSLVAGAGWENMVHFAVRIVEFRRGRARDLGILWNDEAAGPSAALVADVLTRGFLAPPSAPGVPQRVASPRAYFGISTLLDSRLRLLEQRGEALIVAQPTLSCRSGGSAHFIAGGEIPIPITDGLGSTNVEYKEYGVILDVKPIVDASGAIYAHIDTQLSEVDLSQRVLGVPALLKRQSATEVNLHDGETLVVAGLIRRAKSEDLRGLPGLAGARGTGGLFGARLRRNEFTELAIFITPTIARPETSAAVAADDASMAAAAKVSQQALRDRAAVLEHEQQPKPPAEQKQ